MGVAQITRSRDRAFLARYCYYSLFFDSSIWRVNSGRGQRSGGFSFWGADRVESKSSKTPNLTPQIITHYKGDAVAEAGVVGLVPRPAWGTGTNDGRQAAISCPFLAQFRPAIATVVNDPADRR